MISFNRHLATSWAFSVQVGKISIHHENVQTHTSKYLHPWAHGISVKSTIRFSKGVSPTLCTWGGALGPCWGLFLAHKLHLSHIVLLVLESLGTLKCWAKVLSRAVHPEWVPSWNCLTNVGASYSGMAMQPSVNFHHPSGRKCSHLVSNQACFCDVYHGSHSDKGHRNKAAISEANICPVRAPYLASLSAFWFLQTAVVSPFWCP
jgi:hypothetical protein